MTVRSCDHQIGTSVDVNGDGNGFFEAQPLQLLLGNGDLTFQPARRSWSLSSIPDDSFAADFNHDGNLDLALTLNPNGVAILLGNGDGTFATPSILPTDALPNGLTATDLNGDGILDLTVAGLTHDKSDDILVSQSLLLSTPVATYSPSRISLGTVAVGVQSAAVPLTVTNSGNGPLTVTSTSATPPFIVQDSTCAAALDRLGTCQISVALQPTAVGNLNGSLSIATASETPSTLPLTATAALPSLSLDASTLTFGAQMLNVSSPAQTITLSNTSNLPLTLGSITVSGPFTETSACGTSLAAKSSCTLALTFTPTAAGAQTGTLTISSNAAGSPQTLALSGSGVVPLTFSAQTGSSTTATIHAGGTAAYSLVLTAAKSISGTATVSCNGLPIYAACAISPSAPALSDGGTANLTVTVTTSQQVSLNRAKPLQSVQFAGCGLLLCGALLLQRRRKPWMFYLLPVLVLFLALPLSGCSGSSSSSTPPAPKSADTPKGTYQITLSATLGSASTSQVLTLVVQ